MTETDHELHDPFVRLFMEHEPSLRVYGRNSTSSMRGAGKHFLIHPVPDNTGQMGETSNDQHLIQRVLDGNRDGFREIVRKP